LSGARTSYITQTQKNLQTKVRRDSSRKECDCGMAMESVKIVRKQEAEWSVM